MSKRPSATPRPASKPARAAAKKRVAKTQPTAADVTAFIAAIAVDVRRRDAQVVAKLMEEVSGEKPVLWGTSIVGFSRYDYTYESGHSGASPRIAFSPRKTSLVIYLTQGTTAHAADLARLGKHTTGKACLYIKSLAEIDMKVLHAILKAGLAASARQYPTGAG